jgi:tartrate-resistant acid phosphatase type 5
MTTLAQIVNTKTFKCWNFSSPSYHPYFKIPHHLCPSVVLCLLDTVMLCGNTDDFLSQQPKMPQDLVMIHTQMSHLKKQLAEAKLLHVLVTIHPP